MYSKSQNTLRSNVHFSMEILKEFRLILEIRDYKLKYRYIFKQKIIKILCKGSLNLYQNVMEFF